MSQPIEADEISMPGLRIAPRSITVIVADDHPFMLRGLRYFLDEDDHIEVVAEANSGEQAIHLIDHHRPDVAVLDLNMPDVTGLDVARWALQNHVETRILILTAYADAQHIRTALASGVSGYFLKTSNPELVVDAVLALSRGECVFDPAIDDSVKALNAANTAVDLDQLALSKRELDVLDELVRGNTDNGIGQNLGISSYTVGSHMARIFTKLGVATRTQAIARAMSLGLIDSSPNS